jgi:hypothetical protein
MRPLSTIAVFFAALNASSQSASTFEWKGAIEPKQVLEIRNINGDIKAETAPSPEAEVYVRITGTRPDPNTIRIDVVQHEGGILFCTIYEGLSRPEHCTPSQMPSVTLSNSDIRVNYTVRVPSDVSFVPRTINGSISADLPDSRISAYTVNGRIVLSTGLPADAHVVNGSIIATLGNEGSREFGAVNGAVDLEVPETFRASVRANTVWGVVANDFGIPVHRNLVGRWFSGDINGGGPWLALGTVNGSIHLRRAATQ